MRLEEALAKSKVQQAIRRGLKVCWVASKPGPTIFFFRRVKNGSCIWLDYKSARRYQDWVPRGNVMPTATIILQGVNYGLLSPQGVLYGCSFTGHEELAEEIGYVLGMDTAFPQDDLIKNGWIKLSNYNFVDNHKEPTQKQLDTIWDWWRANPQERKPQQLG